MTLLAHAEPSFFDEGMMNERREHLRVTLNAMGLFFLPLSSDLSPRFGGGINLGLSLDPKWDLSIGIRAHSAKEASSLSTVDVSFRSLKIQAAYQFYRILYVAAALGMTQTQMKFDVFGSATILQALSVPSVDLILGVRKFVFDRISVDLFQGVSFVPKTSFYVGQKQVTVKENFFWELGLGGTFWW